MASIRESGVVKYNEAEPKGQDSAPRNQTLQAFELTYALEIAVKREKKDSYNFLCCVIFEKKT